MKKKRKWFIPLFAAAVLVCAFLIYTGIYYHADASALTALVSDEAVSVTRTEYGWFFDGPSESDALIFYPGGKVEETAYAPLLHRLADQGMDVLLVKMPFRLAVFGTNTADKLMAMYRYERWYIGGHSLGGVMAANYAAEHAGQLAGVFLLAAYPIKDLGSVPLLVSIYGSNDGVLNMEKMDAGKQFAPDNSHRYIIEGGNHALFGNYGDQRGDGKAAISAEEQQRLTVEFMIQNKQECSDLMI